LSSTLYYSLGLICGQNFEQINQSVSSGPWVEDFVNKYRLGKNY